MNLRPHLKLLSVIYALSFSACAATPTLGLNERVAELERDLEEERSRSRTLESELAERREELQRMESSLALLRANRERRSEAGERGLPSWDEPRDASWDESWDAARDERDAAHGREESARRMKAPSSDEETLGRPSEPRVTLRLYGERYEESAKASPAPTANARQLSSAGPPLLSDIPLPALPPGEPARPEENVRSAPPSASAPALIARADGDEETDQLYREALSLIRAGRLEEALSPLDRVIQRANDIARRFDGVYWRGEVYFLLKRYAEAEVDFASIASLPAEHARLPSALLRLGHCMRARGRGAAAAAYWKRLSEEFPESSAARQVPQEAIQ